MIPELGHFALVLALILATVQGTVPLYGAARGDGRLMALGSTAAVAQCALVALAFAALTWAYIVSDFSVLNVVQNSHSLKPMLYKVTGVWGNHEGSLLLWLLMLAAFGAAVAVFGGNLPATLKARVLAIQGLIGVGFLAFTVLSSNPFLRVSPAPAEGMDLNPLLQDPGLAFHPPLLYLGYVGFSIAYAFAMAALIEGKVDAAWARWVRPWTLAAWSTLTLGIALGSWWAYYELGWGGWWFWDPVENVSLMPWLAGTALLHSAIVVEKRDALKAWTILLAILTFSLSIMGTFIVRSGLLTSVHAFATDPERGVFILLLLALAAGGGLALFAWRGPSLASGTVFAPVSREGALLSNNLLLSTALATVFVGTLYPLALEAWNGDRVSVGPPYYEATFVPLMVPLVLLMAAGPLMAWRRGDAWAAVLRLRWAMAATLLVVLVTTALVDHRSAGALLGVALGVWALFGAVTDLAQRAGFGRVPAADAWRRLRGLPRAAFGTALAHGGLGIAILGMVGSTVWMVERIESLRPGEQVEIAGYQVRFDGVQDIAGPNYSAEQARLTVTRDGDFVALLTPERRSYPAARMGTTEAAIHTTWLSDVYGVLGEEAPAGNGARVIRVYYHPLVPWIWIGTALMALGGAVSLSDRRLRVGAPTRRRAETATTAGGQQPA